MDANYDELYRKDLEAAAEFEAHELEEYKSAEEYYRTILVLQFVIVREPYPASPLRWQTQFWVQGELNKEDGKPFRTLVAKGSSHQDLVHLLRHWVKAVIAFQEIWAPDVGPESDKYFSASLEEAGYGFKLPEYKRIRPSNAKAHFLVGF